MSARPLTPATIALLALTGFGLLLTQFFWNLWQFDTYQFFPLAIAGALFLAHRGLGEADLPLRPGSWWIVAPATLLALVMLVAASVMWSPWLGAAAFLVSAFAFVWWMGGRLLWAAVFPGWLLLVTVLPPPLKLDTRFALLLQEWAVAGSSRILGLMGIPHLLSGLIIEIPGQRLLVEEACSGINSVLFMTSACVFYALWRRRSLFFLAILYALTIGCVLFGNLVRITAGAWFLFHFQIDLFVGWKHEALGLVLTATYLGFIVLAEAGLAAVAGVSRVAERPPHREGESVLENLFFEGGFKILAVVLVLLGLVQGVRGWDFHFRKEMGRRVNPVGMDGSARFRLPAEINGWKLVGEAAPVPKRAAFEDGVYSHLWQYQRGPLLATLSLDYPFFGYHDVTVCYRNAGWTIQDSRLQRATPENAHIPCMEVEMTRDGGLKAELFYSTVDETGVWLEEPGTRSPYDAQGKPLEEGNLASRLLHRLRRVPYANESYDDAVNYRIQLLAAARGGLGSEQRRQVLEFFQTARPLVASQFVAPPSTPAPTPTPMPVYEPLPDATPDATRRAIEEARKAAESGESTTPDPTRRVLEELKIEATADPTP